MQLPGQIWMQFDITSGIPRNNEQIPAFLVPELPKSVVKRCAPRSGVLGSGKPELTDLCRNSMFVGKHAVTIVQQEDGCYNAGGTRQPLQRRRVRRPPKHHDVSDLYEHG